MTFLMISAILLSMLMILFSKCDQASDLWQQLELASELESDLSDTVDSGRKWLRDLNAGKTQLVLFDWSNNAGAIDLKMDRSVFVKLSSFKIWGLTFSSKLDGALAVFLLLKLPPRKLEPCLDLLLPRLLYICINLPYGPAWNTVVMSGWLPLVATCNCQISYKGRYAGLLVLHLLSVSVCLSPSLSLSL